MTARKDEVVEQTTAAAPAQAVPVGIDDPASEGADQVETYVVVADAGFKHEGKQLAKDGTVKLSPAMGEHLSALGWVRRKV